ncbi:acyl carrier protein [Kineococcus sp. SYSU DK001]|uniref:acyl carrier protein n=1 Tax=Kineococcus sp. SYSU DK001 TaxID=3383122 RepID=UPI003D7E8585
MRETVLEVLRSTRAEFADGPDLPELTDDTVLLESGLDSLGFAVVVTELEDRLGFDPFSEADTPYYPQTVREFVDFYEKAAAAR